MKRDEDILDQFSRALAARAAEAAKSVVAIRGREGAHVSALLWQADIAVTSEQALHRGENFEAVLPGGRIVAATLAGRDPATNIAILRLADSTTAPVIVFGTADLGSIALAVGSDGEGGVTSRVGVVQKSGPAWTSTRGGQIEKRISLDLTVTRSEEGGPVFNARGGLLGMSTLGRGREVLVIPVETLHRVVPALLKDGRILRGWLGAKLQPVAVPDDLQVEAGHAAALMAMSIVADSPAAKGGLVSGDLLLSVAGATVARLRNVAAVLGPDSVGKVLDVRIIRGGAVQTLPLTITARPLG